jgi:hypothetical protein
VFEAQLGGVSQVLVLAAAAHAEMRADRFYPLWRGGDNAEKLGPREPLLHFSDFGLHDFAHGHERDENDKILNARHPFSPEGNVANR